jgi:hypothetical protein
LGKLYEHLGAEASDFAATDGWNLLSLEVLGGWVGSALEARRQDLTQKMKSTSRSASARTFFLEDFVAWTKSLDSRPLQSSEA